MLTTDQKGAIAESAIVHAAIKLGLDVYRPVVEGGRYDMIFDVGPRLLRVQCKWARRLADVIVIRCYSARRTAGGLQTRPYTADEVDVIAAYCPGVDRCYILGPEHFDRRRTVHLRLDAARNNQRRRINWAENFELAARLR
jgi:PD-(D/E)XK nuclease superfamily protein